MCDTLDPYDILPSEISAISTVHPNRLTPGGLEGPSASDLNPVQVLNAVRASVLPWDAKRLPINQNATAHIPHGEVVRTCASAIFDQQCFSYLRKGLF